VGVRNELVTGPDGKQAGFTDDGGLTIYGSIVNFLATVIQPK
jgi:hypothetical protein